MKFKLLKAALFITAFATFAAFTDGDAGAQDKEKARAKSLAVKVAPEANVEPHEWTPAIAPIEIPEVYVEVPNININLPAMDINMGGDWFYEDDSERTEREELRQTYQLSANARVELSNINGSIDIETSEGNAANCVSRAIPAIRTRAN
ncbi:MAG TPA: hypothetical protein VGO96_19465 [Pyrinomonadaceae bacterium]|nr:hypothetical protein [Pyrinomonadaceae bacterium]